MNARPYILPALLLATLLACGGGSSSPTTPAGPTTATKLSYANPTTGDYQLKQNTALSTSTHLVLELWGPASVSGRGVTVSFTLGSSAAAWGNVNSGDAAHTFVAKGTGGFDLGTGTPILKAKVSGNTLVATIAEKGTVTAKTLDKPLLQVALDLQTGTSAGTVITLTPDASKCQVLLANGSLSSNLTINVSSITAQ